MNRPGNKLYKSLTEIIDEIPDTLTKQAFNRNVLTRNNYSVTDKSNGEHYLFYVNSYGLFSFVTRKMEFINIPMSKPRIDFSDTLLDGEYVNNTFYASDILFAKGKDVRKKLFTQRLDTLFDTLMSLRFELLRMKIFNVEHDNGTIHEYPGNKPTKFKSIYEAVPKSDNVLFIPVNPVKDSFIWKKKNSSITFSELSKGPPNNQFVLPTSLQNYFGDRDTLEKLLLNVHKSLTPGGRFIGHTLAYKGNKKLKLLGQKEIDFKKFTRIMEKWDFTLTESRESGAYIYFIFKKV